MSLQFDSTSLDSELTDADQFLTVVLGGEEYGIPILEVQEIKGYTSVTPIPNTPPHVKGMKYHDGFGLGPRLMFTWLEK